MRPRPDPWRGKPPSAPRGGGLPGMVLAGIDRRSQPQGHGGWLHDLFGHGQQLGRQGAQVDLLLQSTGEGRDPLGGVMTAAVEAPIDRGLDPPAGRLEQGGHGQGGGGHHQAGVPAQQLAQPEDDRLP